MKTEDASFIWIFVEFLKFIDFREFRLLLNITPIKFHTLFNHIVLWEINELNDKISQNSRYWTGDHDEDKVVILYVFSSIFLLRFSHHSHFFFVNFSHHSYLPFFIIHSFMYLHHTITIRPTNNTVKLTPRVLQSMGRYGW